MVNLRVVLDTNILVSAFLSPKGLPAQILHKMRWRPTQGTFLRVCYNQAILNEYEEVLSRSRFKFEVTPEERRFVLNVLKIIDYYAMFQFPAYLPCKTKATGYSMA